MTNYLVRTPVKGYTGVIAGVNFAGGQAVVSEGSTAALRYFRSAAYEVVAQEPEGTGGEGEGDKPAPDASEPAPEAVPDAVPGPEPAPADKPAGRTSGRSK